MVSAKLKPGDEARFAAALQKMVAISGEPVEDIMRKQGRIIAEKLAWFTQRVGQKAADGKKHKADVKSTIDMIYVNPLFIAKTISKRHGKKKGNKFANYIRRREAGKAQAMIDQMGITRGKGGHRIEVGMFDGGNRHTRWLKGRRTTVQCVMGYSGVVPKYKKKKAAQVGALKAGWAAAARDLGGTGKLPAYITKGHKTRGHGSGRGKGVKATLKITNRANYIIQNRQMTNMFRTQASNMEEIMATMIKRKLRKAKSKYKV